MLFPFARLRAGMSFVVKGELKNPVNPVQKGLFCRICLFGARTTPIILNSNLEGTIKGGCKDASFSGDRWVLRRKCTGDL